MDVIVRQLFNEGISTATRSVYQSAWRRYIHFCGQHALTPLPLTEHTLCQFAAVLSQAVCWGTIRSYLSGLRFHQISAGLPDPALASRPRLSYILKGIQRGTPKHNQGRRLPITPTLLRKIYAIWAQHPPTFDKTMLWAACCLGFFGFMRAGEFCAQKNQEPSLTTSDISTDARDDPQVLIVHLRRSKTDPFGVGAHLHLGRTNDRVLCPVSAILAYMAIRPPGPGPLLHFQDGTPLSRQLLVRHVRQALAQAGVDTALYNGHSFRIGAATTAAQAGLSDSLIQTLGRWKSAAFIAYIRTPPAEVTAVASRLARC